MHRLHRLREKLPRERYLGRAQEGARDRHGNLREVQQMHHELQLRRCL
jgi:hypothetical protein